MAFFVAKTDAQSISDGGNYISKSGIYPVTLKVVSVKVNEHGARSLDFNVDYMGSAQVFYGLKLDNNNGSESFEAKTFNKLVNIAGLEVVSDPEVQEYKLGKEQVPTDLAILTDFTDLPVQIRIQYEYGIYQGQIKEKKLIKSFYREDGASASEILNKTEIGVQLSKDLAYADNITYKDGLDEDQVKAWKESQKTGTAKPTAKPTANEFTKTPAVGFPA